MIGGMGNDVRVVDSPERKRYEAVIDGKVAGFAEYLTAGRLTVFTHTEVGSEYEGQGVGGALARFGLDDVRAKGQEVLPLCPFVKGWIDRHPDYADLLYRSKPSTATD